MPRRAISHHLAVPAVFALLAAPGWLAAQVAGGGPHALSRQEAIEGTLARNARLAASRADALAARAGVFVARTRLNPLLTSEYTKDAPQLHTLVELPIDFPWLRSRRIGSASEGLTGAEYRLAFERAAAALDADTLYTRALWARARSSLSVGNAGAADTLLRMARARRDAGDVSELEVQLAEVFAGQQATLAALDSVEVTSRLLDLQAVMGLESDGVVIALSDSLGLPRPESVPAVGAATLLVSAAQHALRSADLAVSLERGNIWQPPSLVAGFDQHDPSGGAKGLLPVVGISLPLPLLNRNRGGIAFAEAERERARAQLTLARVESTVEIARARREHTAATARLSRDEALLASAGRVATMSITAYREGAAALAVVLEAQRTARDVMQQYLDDLAAAWIALARLRTLSLTVSP